MRKMIINVLDENANGINEWLGEEYANLPHASIEGEGLNVGPADFIIIPEIFSNIMDQVKVFHVEKLFYLKVMIIY
jgi:hypothetical protein